MEEKPDYSLTEEELLPERRVTPVWLRLIALITVIVFIGMGAVPIVKTFRTRLPSSELMLDSLLLKEQIDRKLLDAVVKIQVVSGDWGPVGLSGQKQGTGFNISSSGVIITNHHVIDGARRITVTFPDGKSYRAKSWAGQPAYDLAVIKLERSGLPAVLWQPDHLPRPGDRLTVIGNPMELKQFVAEGRLVEYTLAKELSTAVLKIDIPIYPGHSGSPVFDSSGQVVAVIFGSMLVTDNGGEKYYGLAVPIKEVLGLMDDGGDA